jgi:very-short-patch-repair endonuclease
VRDPRLIEFAKSMRREVTEPERRLWEQVRAKRFQGVKFRRQHVIGRYIADFYSREVMLIIEVDGDTHAFQEEYDRVREQYFVGLGFRVIRFINSDVTENMEGVLEALALHGQTPPLPTLSPEGERAI